MADIKGVLTTLNHALPSGVDGTRLAQWRLREGRTYADVRSEVANAFDGVNEELLTAWSDLITITTTDYMEYPNGGSIDDMPKLTDLSRPRPRKGTTIGHMIDLWRIGDSLGGTELYFRDTREMVVLAAIRNIIQSGRNVFEKDLLTRFFSTTENALGSSGYDVPFANANPGSITYTPPQWNGKTFLSSHTHYIGYDSGGGKTFDDVFSGLALTINEHGFNGPYTAYVSEADTVTIRNLTNYVKPVNNIQLVDRGGLTSGAIYYENGMLQAMPAVGGRYIGAYDTGYGPVYLRATNRLPTGYVGMFKSYGQNDPRNPIAVRVHPDVLFGFRIKEIPSFDTTWPVKEINIEAEYGISCGMNRTIGAAGYLVSGGVYVNPTIS